MTSHSGSLAEIATAKSMRIIARAVAFGRLETISSGLDHIPATGPAIIVVRHYHHFYDGLALFAALPDPTAIEAADPGCPTPVNALGALQQAIRDQNRGQVWLYTDTVNKTSLSSRIAAMQTLATEEGKQMVLSVTQSDGTNVKYLIKLPQADKLVETTKAQEAVTKEKVSSWELERLGTALSIGNNSLPNGIALQMSQAEAR